MVKKELLMGPKWVYPEDNPSWLEQIIKEFNIHPVTAQILVSRGFKSLAEIHDYLYAKLPNLLDPYLFRDMDKAVARILKALQEKQGILIYGDNDVDGMSATALLTEFFQLIGAKVSFHIPNSSIHKNGIISDALQQAQKTNSSLVITVDCGITAALEEIKKLHDHNIDVIITDHHEPTAKIPHCIATLNPKLTDSTYPNREITGVGVAFKLAHGLTNELISSGKIDKSTIELKNFLDLVALGTIADMGALLGENRILVRYGLQQLAKTQRMGLLKLFHLCEMTSQEITPIDVASKIAPRLNSLGRVADPLKGVELLLIKEETAATNLAKELDMHNIARQNIERKASENIEDFIASHPEVLRNKAIVLYSDKWHPGVIPIICARITKQYNRPTMLIAIEKGVGKGSLRTIPAFPLLNVLKENKDLLINFGGHDFAAGLVVEKQNISALKKAFIDCANKQLKDKDISPKLRLDAKISFNDLTFDFMESFSLLEPFGNENPAPILYCDAKQIWAPKVVGKTHLKVYLEQNDRMLEGIGFGMAKRKKSLLRKGLKLHVAFSPHINTFLNKTSIQLQLKDFKIIHG